MSEVGLGHAAAVVVVLALVPASAVAHGGGLDSRGCHTNRKTGDYHCHRAQSAPRAQPPRPVRPSADVEDANRQSLADAEKAAAGKGSVAQPLVSQPQPPPAPAPLGIEVVASQVPPTPQELTLIAQALLTTLGYEPGRINGVPSAMLAAAIKRFQASQRLPTTGLVSGALLVVLSQAVADRERQRKP